MKKVILTADRPTGKLHIGHFVGSLQNRVALQNEGDFEKMYVMIADSQALTDNAKNVKKIEENILEVLKDYLAVGLDPKKVCIFLQSEIPELCELTFYYLNLVTVSRLQRNPTVKEEIKLRNFERSIPAGFLVYPVSQTADITAFGVNCVPVGEDQLPMIEQCREIVRSFNQTYGQTLVEPEAVLPKNALARRLPGIDGNAKMGKSLNNAIYLADDEKTLHDKVFSMYTDPNHIKVEDPGKVEGNMVFVYLDVFCKDEHFAKYLPEYKNLDELKAHYRKGGLGDVKIKKFLLAVLNEVLLPIREKRKSFDGQEEFLKQILIDGSKEAQKVAQKTLQKVRKAMGIEFLR